MSALPSGTVTFLFTDIEGSTQLLRQLRDRYRSVIAAHGELLRAAFSLVEGEVIDTQGDAFFVVFRRARDAASAAAAAQRALAAHDWPADGRVRVRMGMHTGEPEVAEAGYLGLGVHRAARICSAAHGGQVLLSQATASVLADEELADLDVRDLGEHRLKDFDRPVRLYQLVGAGLEGDFPPLRTAGADLDVEVRNQELGEAALAPIAEPLVLRHRRALLAGAVLLAAAVVAAVVVALTGESNRHAPVAVLPDSVAVIDTKTNGVAGDVALGSTPTWIAYGDGAVWASETDSSQIARIDARTLALATKGLPGLPGEAVFGTADVFVNEFQGARIFELSPATGEFVDSISVVHGRVSREFGLGGIAIGGGRLWVGNSADSTLVEIDPDAATILKRTPTPGETILALALGKGALWATTLQQDVLRIESDTDRVSSTIPVTNSPNGVAVARDTVWVADGPKAIAIDAGTGVVKQTVAIGTPTSPLGTGFGQGVQGIVVAGNDVWVTDPIGGRVLRVDARDGTIKATIHVGRTPAGIAVGGGRVWVAVDP